MDIHFEASIPPFITGNKDISKEWHNDVAGFKGVKLEKYLQDHQDAYDEWRTS